MSKYMLDVKNTMDDINPFAIKEDFSMPGSIGERRDYLNHKDSSMPKKKLTCGQASTAGWGAVETCKDIKSPSVLARPLFPGKDENDLGYVATPDRTPSKSHMNLSEYYLKIILLVIIILLLFVLRR